jgi:hypothetical protein
MKNEQSEREMAEFIAKGGVIQKAAYRESGRVEGAPYSSPWGAGKKAVKPPVATSTEPPVKED